MTEVLWPLDLCPSSQTWSIIGNAATFTSPLSGATRTYGRPGARLGCTMTFPPMKGQDRARLLAFINTLLDRSNRVWVPDFSTTRRGSFSAPELLTNNDFSNGTTGWTAQFATLSASDRSLRIQADGSSASNIGAYQVPAAVTQYAPYVVRGFVSQSVAMSTVLYSNGGNAVYSQSSSSPALLSQAVVPSAASLGATYPALFVTSGVMRDCFVDVLWSSASRCALVDGGGNLLTHSDQFDNAAWTKIRSSISADATVAPDGTATMDYLQEDSTASNTHFVTQSATVSSAAHDIVWSIEVAPGTRSWIELVMIEATGSTPAYAFFNVGVGVQAVGTVSQAGNWSNARAFIEDLGNNRCRCTIIARKTNAATSVAYQVRLSTGDLGDLYSGDGSSGLYIRRGGSVPSSVPVRVSQTTTAAVSASTQTGNGIYVKGLPPSTQGLLEAGDPVQIGGQINFLTARLDSDAAGRGYLQCGRPWLAATNDAPVIVNTPMCKMILATDTLDLDTGPGQFSPFQIELVEAIE